MMRKQKAIKNWNEVKRGDAVIGTYAVDDGMIYVRKASGGEKVTHASNAGDNEGLARLILSESTGWK